MTMLKWRLNITYTIFNQQLIRGDVNININISLFFHICGGWSESTTLAHLPSQACFLL